MVNLDFSPAFEAKPDGARSKRQDEGAAKRARWYCVPGLRLPRESRVSGVAATRLTAVPRDNVVTGKTPQTYPLSTSWRIEEADEAQPDSLPSEATKGEVWKPGAKTRA